MDTVQSTLITMSAPIVAAFRLCVQAKGLPESHVMKSTLLMNQRG
jgi:hypothetical protein